MVTTKGIVFPTGHRLKCAFHNERISYLFASNNTRHARTNDAEQERQFSFSECKEHIL